MGIYDQLTQLDTHAPPPPDKRAKPDLTPKKQDVVEINDDDSPTEKSADRKPQKASNQKQANKLVKKQSRKQTIKKTSKHVYIQTFLAKKAGDTVTFRLPPELMNKFEEIEARIRIEHKAKLKRYEMVVTALAFLFWDFEKNGADSELCKTLIGDNQK
ncbi:MAG: hypothetical protein GY805_14130 [Chloroflexi bacterium]|nr:hypothetical protein [Chloroflexota bacterium]